MDLYGLIVFKNIFPMPNALDKTITLFQYNFASILNRGIAGLHDFDQKLKVAGIRIKKK